MFRRIFICLLVATPLCSGIAGRGQSLSSARPTWCLQVDPSAAIPPGKQPVDSSSPQSTTPLSEIRSDDKTARVSSGVMELNIAKCETPIVSQAARASNVNGAVVLYAHISKQGDVDKLEVISGPQLFRASTLDAVRKWKYKPYLLNGVPTAVDTTVTVVYDPHLFKH